MSTDPYALAAAAAAGAALVAAGGVGAYFAADADSSVKRAQTMMGFIPAALHNELAHFGLVADALLAYGASTWLEWAIESAGVHPSLAWGVYLSTLGLSAVAAFKHANLLAASIQSVAEYAAALTRANIKNNVAQKMASPLVWLKIALWVPYYWHLGGIRLVRHVPFTEDTQHKELQLDVYLPTAAGVDLKKAPVLFYIHGGGWIVGDKGVSCIALLKHMAQAGWIVYSVNYRLAPKHKFPQGLYDVKKALAWVRQTGLAKYGGDAAKVVVGGESAGGHIAALVALTQNDPAYQPGFEKADTSVIACVDIYGVHDFAGFEGHRADVDGGLHARFLRNTVTGKKVEDHVEFYESINPMTIVSKKTSAEIPPFINVQGTHDTLVMVGDARSYAKKLKAVRDAAQPHHKPRTPDVFIELPKAPHGYNYLPGIRGEGLNYTVESYLAHVVAKL